MFLCIYHLCSSFHNNIGGGGGVLSTRNVPLVFKRNSSFIKNKGRTLVVGDIQLFTKCMCLQAHTIYL